MSEFIFAILARNRLVMGQPRIREVFIITNVCKENALNTTTMSYLTSCIANIYTATFTFGHESQELINSTNFDVFFCEKF